ncbi:MAG TPA: PASTA domain-containing protein [Candidatus Baltobacteraceae bacterium]|nr:PASTA domain-containing protein [Candidatus Baltobacteraceae bacterium]
MRLGKVLPSNGNGVVFRQSLEANRCVPLSTPVDVWIENVAPPPAVEVPDLRGQSSLGATLLLTIRGLKYGGSSKEQSREVAPGKIFSQQPAAGSMVPKGTTVVVTLAEPVTVPPPTPYKPSPPQETLTLKSNLYGPAIPGELVTFTGVAQGSAHTIHPTPRDVLQISDQ